MWLHDLIESSLPLWGLYYYPHSTDEETEAHGVK